MLSILIPIYNYTCAHLVCDLQKQCEEVQATLGEEVFDYEIIVADDGSDAAEDVARNAVIDMLPHCRYEVRNENVGRAAIRNWLVQQAKFDWLLIIDCDAEVISDDFVLRYWQAATDERSVVVGGIRTPNNAPRGCELRHRYELAADAIRTVEARQKEPAMFFSTFNFMCPRHILLQIPFDERCTEYGYEDALFGIQVEEGGYSIVHIDNPLLHCGINDNANFLRNSETALRSLHRLGPPMTTRARVAKAAAKMKDSCFGKYVTTPLFILLYKMSAPLVRRNLLSHKPSQKLFAFYKLGYYLCIK